MKFLKLILCAAATAILMNPFSGQVSAQSSWLTTGTPQGAFVNPPFTAEAITCTNGSVAFLVTASSITNISAATLAGAPSIPVPRGGSMAFQCRFAAAGAGSNPLRFTFNTSVDGTNFTTVNPIEFFTAPAGTAGIIDWTNFPAVALNNVKFIRLTSISNTTAQVIGITNATLAAYR